MLVAVFLKGGCALVGGCETASHAQAFKFQQPRKCDVQRRLGHSDVLHKHIFVSKSQWCSASSQCPGVCQREDCEKVAHCLMVLTVRKELGQLGDCRLHTVVAFKNQCIERSVQSFE